MATKLTDTCLQKAADDEPIFVLRAQDKLAANLVRNWAQQAAMFLGNESPKVQEAFALADAMDRWPTQKYPD